MNIWSAQDTAGTLEETGSGEIRLHVSADAPTCVAKLLARILTAAPPPPIEPKRRGYPDDRAGDPALIPPAPWLVP